jgi:hypothetical protein
MMMSNTKKPKLTVVPDLTAEETLGEAADEAVNAEEAQKQAYEELRSSNVARIQALNNEGYGPLVGGPLLQMRLETFIDAYLGSDGPTRDNFEYVFEHRVPVMLDQLEQGVKYAKAQRLAGPGAAMTENGLIVPS